PRRIFVIPSGQSSAFPEGNLHSSDESWAHRSEHSTALFAGRRIGLAQNLDGASALAVHGHRFHAGSLLEAIRHLLIEGVHLRRNALHVIIQDLHVLWAAEVSRRPQHSVRVESRIYL